MARLDPDRTGPAEGDAQLVQICGRRFLADRAGGLYWPGRDVLVVADLHLEKGSALAARGRMLPPYDTRETLMRLAEVLEWTGAQTVIALGDSLHDPAGAERIGADDLAALHLLQERRRWVWVHGNHDPVLAPVLGGERVSSIVVDGITFRHEPAAGHVTHEIAGHLHPAARLSMHGASIRRPCFVGNGRRLVMPAFGAFTGGLNVLDEAFEPVFAGEVLSVWMLGRDGLYPVPARQLRPD